MERREARCASQLARASRKLEVVTGRARVIKNSTAREDCGLASLLVHHGPGQCGGPGAREHLAAALQHLALGRRSRAGARLVSAARELLGHFIWDLATVEQFLEEVATCRLDTGRSLLPQLAGLVRTVLATVLGQGPPPCLLGALVHSVRGQKHSTRPQHVWPLATTLLRLSGWPGQHGYFLHRIGNLSLLVLYGKRVTYSACPSGSDKQMDDSQDL